MGLFSSKPKEAGDIDNSGLLNGNSINNGLIVQDIDSEVNNIDKELVNIQKLLYVLIIMLLVMILFSMVKTLMKYVKKSVEQEKRIESMVLNNL